MRLGHSGGAEYGHLHLQGAFGCPFRLHAGAVPDAGAAPAGWRGASDLHDLLLALPAALDLDHGEGAGPKHWRALDAGSSPPRHAAESIRDGRGLLPSEPERREIPRSEE